MASLDTRDRVSTGKLKASVCLLLMLQQKNIPWYDLPLPPPYFVPADYDEQTLLCLCFYRHVEVCQGKQNCTLYRGTAFP